MQWLTLSALIAVSSLASYACSGHKPHGHHGHDRPDTGVPTSPDTTSPDTTSPDTTCPDATSPDTTDDTTVDVVSCSLIEQQVEEYGDMPSGVCAEEQPTCEIGRECCCGRCAPNVVCDCYEGTWVCYYTDFCLIPFCPDGGLGPDGSF
jgi:hypothetical protein